MKDDPACTGFRDVQVEGVRDGVHGGLSDSINRHPGAQVAPFLGEFSLSEVDLYLGFLESRLSPLLEPLGEAPERCHVSSGS